ncbi:hypothetical protein [Flavihumibacter petaseus]|uniref:Secretion system C-terminal sorting domain-containing protein n=1 Tax=Flavihumibacter petaseus NBRC 106054 TaxID=1220578 RepID=A0A0E9N567_9BACT|nr:hypothetical protein [Flavihumibacter petaseus]GAO44841.1 hypothetical protein FPE01S_04_00840 [Flavihumibacter petaseus NBRC 106054]
MKTIRQLLPALILLAGGAGVQPCSARSVTDTVKTDSIIIQKNLNDKKYSVNIYTNASQQVLFFSAAGEEGKTYQLLLFRQKGKLIKQSRIRNRETAVVSKPDKGNYYFEVFSDDVRIETGTIEVR